ncbi:MAG TPA: hypothetical protein VE074_16015 [Jatrophihabitantaceae bacterium]|nr:hypothetical protein [Jatrophihabitantaceae bacterium]
MSTALRVRPYPCTRCGEKIVIVESQVSSLGGLWRLESHVAVQHADFEPADGQPDQIDDACRRTAGPRGPLR